MAGLHLTELRKVEGGTEGRHDILSPRGGLIQKVVQGCFAADPAAGAAREPVYAQPPAALPAQYSGNHLQGPGTLSLTVGFEVLLS